jgi:hypothetical protein
MGKLKRYINRFTALDRLIHLSYELDIIDSDTYNTTVDDLDNLSCLFEFAWHGKKQSKEVAKATLDARDCWWLCTPNIDQGLKKR